MPCYDPKQCFKLLNCTTPNGKAVIRFKRPTDVRDKHEEMKVACGNCIGCKLEYSRQWAVRCLHESKQYEFGRGNCFITLTFSDRALVDRQIEFGTHPLDLDVRDFQRFMKRLRKRFGSGIRFFHCGEYGDKLGRPHYHAIIFNLDFPDKRYLETINGNKYYSSKILEELWPYGKSSIGEVNFNTIAYVARYVIKKVNGVGLKDNYVIGVDNFTGEVLTRRKEYVTMSRNGGIGKRWFLDNKDRTCMTDSIRLNGKEMSSTRYYDKQLELLDPTLLASLKERRKLKALEVAGDNTPERLKDKEKVAKARLDLFSNKRGDL